MTDSVSFERLATTLRKKAPASGLACTPGVHAAGWSVILTAPGFAGMDCWMLSGKRVDRGAPTERDLAWLRRLVQACCDACDGSSYERVEALHHTFQFIWKVTS